MKTLRFTVASAVMFTALVPWVAGNAQAPDDALLSDSVQKLFAERCGACHKTDAPQEESPHLVNNLGALNDPEYINKEKPEDSKLYTLLVNGSMPKTSRAERAEGKKAKPLSPDETQLVLAWIRAGAPAPSAVTNVVLSPPPPTSPSAPPADVAPPPTPPIVAPAQQPTVAETPKPQTPAPKPNPLPADRTVVTEAQILAGALQNLLSQPEEDRADIRYLSIHPQHNNVEEIDDVDAWLARCGIRKLLNSLSTNPKIAEFEKTGPEQVLHRIRLRDIGWTAAMWDKVTATYPYALDSSSLAALSGPTKCAVPVVRADWFVATASRPPLYDTLLNHPENARDLEKRLGVDIPANLSAGKALRSGFTQSGVSKQNRLVERHDLGTYAGFYWKSYDFKHNNGRGRLADFPLGPSDAHLFRGAHAFQHDGGEIIYSLPNGLQAYLLVDSKDNTIDIGPIEVVSDRFDKTGRAQIVNGFSCMACHDKGMKELPLDELRAVAGSARFGAEEQRLIERLHPPQDDINAIVKADAISFQKAVAAANVDPAAKKEPVLALVDFFEADVSLAQAAAELGMKKAKLDAALDANAALFDTRTALRGPGIPRIAFVDHFLQMAVRLGLGKPRLFDDAPKVIATATDHAGVQAARAANHLAVEVRSNKSTYKEDEIMLFTVQTSEDAFIRLLYQDAHGNVIILIPNRAFDGKTKAGVPITFGDGRPVNGGPSLFIRCKPPFGNEMVAAVASNTPFKGTEDLMLEAKKSKGGLVRSNRRGKGAEIEIVDTIRARTQEARVGVARLLLTTHQ